MLNGLSEAQVAVLGVDPASKLFFTEDNDITSLDVSFQILNYFTFSILGNVFLPFRIN